MRAALASGAMEQAVQVLKVELEVVEDLAMCTSVIHGYRQTMVESLGQRTYTVVYK